MSSITRRQFLLASATLPFLKLAIPPLLSPRAAAGAGQQQEGQTKPNILVIVFDAFSAQHLSMFGYPRESTPNINRLAQGATVYHHHYAAGNYTSTGTASLLTGLYPWTHRCIQFYGHALASVAGNNIFNLLPDDYYKVAYTHNPLAAALLYQFEQGITQLKPRLELMTSDALMSERLFGNDYPVAVHAERVIAGQNRPASAAFAHVLHFLGMERADSQNDATYSDLFPKGLPAAPFDAFFTIEDAVNWVNELATTVSNPYFAYVHLFPPHAPYNTRGDFVDVFNDGWQPVEKASNPFFSRDPSADKMLESRRAYDEFIAYVDAEFGRLFDMLERSGALDNTYLVLTSDHGEMFERGYVGHGGSVLYDPVVHIPLMIWKPGQRERVDVTRRTSAVDLVPTFLHLAGQTIPDACEGTVLPTFGDDPAGDRFVYSVEAKLNNSFTPLTTATLTAYQGPYKLIHYMGYEELDGQAYNELFDLENDPQELENLASDRKSVTDELAALLTEKLDEVNRPFRRA